MSFTRISYLVLFVIIISIGTSNAYALSPDQITDLSLAVVSSTQVDLSWTTPDDGGSPILGYHIFRNLNGAGFTPLQAVGDPTLTTFSDNTLSPGDKVKYAIRAVSAIGKAPISNIPTPVTTTGGSAPDAVTDLALTVVSGTQVDLSWSTPADNGSPITGYKIKSKVNGVVSTIETSFGDASTTSYSDTSLSAGDVVTYRIAAINAEGQGPFSNIPPSVITSGGGNGKNVPAVIPLRPGFYDGGSVYYIATESSDATTAGIITADQGWTVNLSTLLSSAPAAAVSPVYVFTNGIAGDGIHGFQPEVFLTVPSNAYDEVTEMSTPNHGSEYTSLKSHVEVTWNGGHTPTLLDSVADILQAEIDGKVTLATPGIVSNFSHIVWPGDAMQIRVDTTLNDDTPFRPPLPSGQIIDIDTNAMTVTFVAHKVWGTGDDSMYIVCTDFSLAAPAKQMGIPYVPLNRNIWGTPTTASMAQFTNGGGSSGDNSGPFYQQAGIGDVDVGDVDYTPFQDVPKVQWVTPLQAYVVTSYPELDDLVTSGDIVYTTLAEDDAILNCPIVDPMGET